MIWLNNSIQQTNSIQILTHLINAINTFSWKYLEALLTDHWYWCMYRFNDPPYTCHTYNVTRFWPRFFFSLYTATISTTGRYGYFNFISRASFAKSGWKRSTVHLKRVDFIFTISPYVFWRPVKYFLKS